jgi:hypothetical protein
LNLKIANSDLSNLDPPLNIQNFELDLAAKSIEYEKTLVLQQLDEISSRFLKETLVFEGVECRRKISSTEISIGRVTVKWDRPIYIGYKEGKPVRYYPADQFINLPRKTKGSYQVLSNCALLCAFLPFALGRKIINLLMGINIGPATVKRYTETVGQFASENLPEILAKKVDEVRLKEDEILIASIDGSSSLINGSRSKSNKRKKKRNKKKVKSTQKMTT